jgi:hypothetical protein
LKFFHKECEQELSERLEVVGRLKRILTFEGVEGRQEAKCLEELKEGVVMLCCKEMNSTHRNTLFRSCRNN